MQLTGLNIQQDAEQLLSCGILIAFRPPFGRGNWTPGSPRGRGFVPRGDYRPPFVRGRPPGMYISIYLTVSVPNQCLLD